MDFVYFLGRFHVLVLHLPIALVLTVVLAEWLARKERYSYLRPALGFLWGASALTAIATVVLGYMHFSEGGFTGSSAGAHRLFGTSVAVVATIAWVLRTFSLELYQKGQAAIGVILLALVTLTGHYGGNLTHGDTYLVEYAPEPLRRLAGLSPAREPVTDIALADPYLDIVQPMLSQRCFSCHNDDKQRGGLNLANLEDTLKGGEGGAILVAGKPDESDLYRRITVAHEDEDFMPAEGKTPLTDDQVAIVRWWIEAGMPAGTTVTNMHVADDVRPLLAAQLGIAHAVGAPLEDVATVTADPAVIGALVEAGFAARQVALTDSSLIVSAPAPGGAFPVEKLAALQQAAASIVELNLSRSNITDEALSIIGSLPELTHLRLDNNQLSDKGLAALRNMSELTYLNLHGNKGITDAGLDALAQLPALRKVFLWNTSVSARGVAALRARRADIQVDIGEPGFVTGAGRG